jgi:hypothetical protein
MINYLEFPLVAGQVFTFGFELRERVLIRGLPAG